MYFSLILRNLLSNSIYLIILWCHFRPSKKYSKKKKFCQKNSFILFSFSSRYSLNIFQLHFSSDDDGKQKNGNLVWNLRGVVMAKRWMDGLVFFPYRLALCGFLQYSNHHNTKFIIIEIIQPKYRVREVKIVPWKDKWR